MRQSGCGQPSSYVATVVKGAWDAFWVNPATVAQPGLCLRPGHSLHLKAGLFFPRSGLPQLQYHTCGSEVNRAGAFFQLWLESIAWLCTVCCRKAVVKPNFSVLPGGTTYPLLMSGAQASLWLFSFLTTLIVQESFCQFPVFSENCSTCRFIFDVFMGKGGSSISFPPLDLLSRDTF